MINTDTCDYPYACNWRSIAFIALSITRYIWFCACFARAERWESISCSVRWIVLVFLMGSKQWGPPWIAGSIPCSWIYCNRWPSRLEPCTAQVACICRPVCCRTIRWHCSAPCTSLVGAERSCNHIHSTRDTPWFDWTCRANHYCPQPLWGWPSHYWWCSCWSYYLFGQCSVVSRWTRHSQACTEHAWENCWWPAIVRKLRQLFLLIPCFVALPVSIPVAKFWTIGTGVWVVAILC